MERVDETIVSGRQLIRIDFLGAPGAGKSTVCAALLKNIRESGLPWVSIRDSLKTAESRKRKVIGADGQQVRRFLSRLRQRVIAPLLGKHRSSRTTPELFKDYRLAAVRSFLTQHQCFFELLAEHWFDPEARPAALSERYLELLRWTDEWLFAINESGETHILADNARFTRGIAELLRTFGESDERFQCAFTQYLRFPLRPSGVLHFTGDVKTILSHIEQRQKGVNGQLNAAHQRRTPDELHHYTEHRIRINSDAVASLRRQGIPVCELQADESVQQKVSRILQFLKEDFLKPVTQSPDISSDRETC